jgi:sulfide:quinone oxidoreductase
MLASDIHPATAAARERPRRVLIAGGGIAALELLLALRILAGSRVAITLLSANADLAPPAMTVAEPFERGGAQRYAWSQIAEQQGARLVIDALIAVDTAERIAFTNSGRRLGYDILAVTTGARRVAPFADALTFGTSTNADATTRLQAVLADDGAATVAFTLPSPSIWPLPLYELALLAAAQLRERGSLTAVRLVTPEKQPLQLFGPAARDALTPTLDALGIDLITRAQPREVVAGALKLADGQLIAADHVITFADVIARPVPGLPTDRLGFIPVDLHGHVEGHPHTYAAGEVTSFPLRQGGLATQQADAVAEAIAVACGADVAPQPFRPVLRGRLLTSGAPLYLQSRPSGQSAASTNALWSPPEKIAGRYLAPYLATARPARLGASSLVDRVPARAATADEHDAVALALALAEAEARCGNTTRARQALEAAQTLDPDAAAPSHEQIRARLNAKISAR